MKLTVPLDKSVTITVPEYGEFDCMFAQPTQGDVQRRADLNVRTVPFNHAIGRMHDVYFVIRECSIETPDGRPIWHPTRLKNHTLNLPEFQKGWDLLPPEIADAIWEAAMEVSPAWDWRPKETEEEGSFREWDTPPQPQT